MFFNKQLSIFFIKKSRRPWRTKILLIIWKNGQTFDRDKFKSDRQILWKVKLWVYNYSYFEFTYRSVTKKLNLVIKNLNSDLLQLMVEKRRNFKGDPFCPRLFYIYRIYIYIYICVDTAGGYIVSGRARAVT